MNTCDTCKWWGDVSRCDITGNQYGQNKQCDHIVRDGGVSYESSVSPIHDNNYRSDLYTGPKFGCIHHEAKP